MMYEVKIIKQFELEDKHIKFLEDINKIGYAEFRDWEYDDFNEYNKLWEGADVGYMTEEQFNSRNFGATSKEAEYLNKLGLIEDVGDSWHKSFKISELGIELLKQNS